MVKGKPYKEWLNSLGLFSLGETEERSHCILQLPPKGQTPISALSDKGQDPSKLLELCQGRLKLDIRKVLPPEGDWALNRLLREWSQSQG